MTERYVRNQKMADKMRNVRKTAIKDLTENEIERGRKHLVKSAALGMVITGPIGAGAALAVDESRARKYVKEYDRSYSR